MQKNFIVEFTSYGIQNTPNAPKPLRLKLRVFITHLYFRLNILRVLKYFGNFEDAAETVLGEGRRKKAENSRSLRENRKIIPHFSMTLILL